MQKSNEYVVYVLTHFKVMNEAALIRCNSYKSWLQYCNVKVHFYFESAYSKCGTGILSTTLYNLR